MHRSRIRDEVQSGPRISHEEFARQHVAFEAIAASTREHEVARDVRAAVREGIDVVERREIKLQRRRAVHTTPAAVPHRRAFDGALLMSGGDGSAAT